jgi:hypothetical protein
MSGDRRQGGGGQEIRVFLRTCSQNEQVLLPPGVNVHYMAATIHSTEGKSMIVPTARTLVAFIVIGLSIGINLGQHMLEMLNVDRNFLMVTLAAIAIAGLLAHRHLLFMVLVSALTIAINLPPELLNQFQVNQDVLLVTLLAVILMPTGGRLLGLAPST